MQIKGRTHTNQAIQRCFRPVSQAHIQELCTTKRESHPKKRQTAGGEDIRKLTRTDQGRNQITIAASCIGTSGKKSSGTGPTQVKAQHRIASQLKSMTKTP